MPDAVIDPRLSSGRSAPKKALRIAWSDPRFRAIVWQAVDNRKPLRAIKIEVRFVDPSTQQMRQLTLIQSLVD